MTCLTHPTAPFGAAPFFDAAGPAPAATGPAGIGPAGIGPPSPHRGPGDVGTAPAPDAARLARACRSLMPVARKPAAVFVRGQGDWLWDAEGRRHLDFVQGWAVNTLGHAPPEIAEALARQGRTLLQAGPGFHNDQAALLAESLAQASGLGLAFFTTSGAEANEGAVKLARKHGQVLRGGASRILAFGHGFHGRTLAMMAASGKPGFGQIYSPAVPGFVHSPYNDLAAAEALLAADAASGRPTIAAVLLELVQGEAGVVEASAAFAQGLQALCRRHGALLMVDEVQTGIGRCGTLFAFQRLGLAPDVVTLGKGLGGGVPIGAVLARPEACHFAPGDQGGTYNGNPLVCAVARAVLAAVQAPGFLDRVQASGQALAEGLARISVRHGLGAVHGRGLLRALDLPPGIPSAALADAAREPTAGDGLLVNPVQPQRLRFMPALNLAPDALAQGLDLLEAALRRVQAAPPEQAAAAGRIDAPPIPNAPFAATAALNPGA